MPDGTIWRVAEMRSNRWNNELSLRPVTRRRAEHDQGQYLQIRWMTKRVRTYCLAHRLVWLHFHGKIPPGAQINHKNGKKQDNHPANLELVTPSENLRHAHRLELINQQGQRNPNAKLTNSQVETIRQMYAVGGVTQKQLAEQFTVTFQTISKIVTGSRRMRQAGKTADYRERRIHPVTRDKSGKFLG